MIYNYIENKLPLVYLVGLLNYTGIMKPCEVKEITDRRNTPPPKKNYLK
jgi:hypothetical protein